MNKAYWKISEKAKQIQVSFRNSLSKISSKYIRLFKYLSNFKSEVKGDYKRNCIIKEVIAKHRK